MVRQDMMNVYMKYYKREKLTPEQQVRFDKLEKVLYPGRYAERMAKIEKVVEEKRSSSKNKKKSKPKKVEFEPEVMVEQVEEQKEDSLEV